MRYVSYVHKHVQYEQKGSSWMSLDAVCSSIPNDYSRIGDLDSFFSLSLPSPKCHEPLWYDGAQTTCLRNGKPIFQFNPSSPLIYSTEI